MGFKKYIYIYSYLPEFLVKRFEILLNDDIRLRSPN